MFYTIPAVVSPTQYSLYWFWGVILIKAGRGSELFPNLTISSSFSGPCGPEKDLHVHEELLNFRITDPGFNPGRALSREETQEL